MARTEPVAFPSARYSCLVFIRTRSRITRFSSAMPESPPMSSISLNTRTNGRVGVKEEERVGRREKRDEKRKGWRGKGGKERGEEY